MGVSVSEITPDTRMAALIVTANSCSRRPSTPPMKSTGMNTATSEIVMEMMGMGMTPQHFDSMIGRVKSWMDGLFRESVMMLADGLGASLERVESTLEVELAEEPFDIAAGRIEAGTVAAQRYRWEGIVGGQARIIEECVYRAAPHVAPGWGPTAGWDVRIEGWPDAHLTVGHELISRGVVATAAHAVNAIAAVHAAPPGISTFLTLPPIGGRMS